MSNGTDAAYEAWKAAGGSGTKRPTKSTAKWMKKYTSPHRPIGSSPVSAGIIESNLADLKGREITQRVLKDNWGGNSDMMQASLDAIVDQMRPDPNQDDRKMGDGQKKGFYAAGTTSFTDPSRQTRIKKPAETKAAKHAYGPGQLLGGGRKADLTGGFKR